MNSNYIKLQLMKYFRYDNGYHFVCSECINNADITAIDSKKLIEVEIKVSWNDFLNEFNEKSRNKTLKHKVYESLEKPYTNYVIPNYFYFCVTKELQHKCYEYLNEHKPKYGLLVVEDYKYRKSSYIKSIKPAKKLHDNKPSVKTWIEIGKRVQSEMIGLKEKQYEVETAKIMFKEENDE